MKRSKGITFWILMVLLVTAAIWTAFCFFSIPKRSANSGFRSTEVHLASQPLNASSPIGIWESDPLLGYSHRANSQGIHKTKYFEVKYTIGPEQERYIPKPINPKGRILFLGCSWTFGHGVNDDEAYPAILAGYWKDWHIVDKAVMGWGTAHAYQVLSRELNSSTPPDVVIYGMLREHIYRNYIRANWVSVLGKYNRSHPYFELVHGHLQFQGVVTTPKGKEDSKETEDKEIRLTKAFLTEMQKSCRPKNVPFIVIFLKEKPPLPTEKTLIENNIPYLDLTRIPMENCIVDLHPNREGHKRLAEAINESFIPAILESVSKPSKK